MAHSQTPFSVAGENADYVVNANGTAIAHCMPTEEGPSAQENAAFLVKCSQAYDILRELVATPDSGDASQLFERLKAWEQRALALLATA